LCITSTNARDAGVRKVLSRRSRLGSSRREQVRPPQIALHDSRKAAGESGICGLGRLPGNPGHRMGAPALLAQQAVRFERDLEGLLGQSFVFGAHPGEMDHALDNLPMICGATGWLEATHERHRCRRRRNFSFAKLCFNSKRSKPHPGNLPRLRLFVEAFQKNGPSPGG
jgi:hypothetical protein